MSRRRDVQTPWDPESERDAELNSSSSTSETHAPATGPEFPGPRSTEGGCQRTVYVALETASCTGGTAWTKHL